LAFAIPRFTAVEMDGVLIHPDRDGYVRMLPSYWEKIKPALRDLDFDAQEYVCQLCAQYRIELDPKVANAYKRRRAFLAKSEKQLKQLIKWLDQKPDLEQFANAVRLAHRPLGCRVTPLELAGLSTPDRYFTRNGIPDPGKPILTFIENIHTLEVALRGERDFFNSEPGRTHALWKTQPNLRKGRMEYLLQRIFRERSRPKGTLKAAHRRMGVVFRRLFDRKLKFDQEKGYCPAIYNAINRLKPEEKSECDQRLLKNLNLPRPRN
jgi:hypothetical protein